MVPLSKRQDLFYFAYGSNLFLPRLRGRVACARLRGPAILREHRLRFHKVGQDSSGKCDADYTGCGEDRVWGALFQLSHAGQRTLDAIEGLGRGYEHAAVNVELNSGARVQAFTYRAMVRYRDPRLKPFDWYREYVIRGSRMLGLPFCHRARIRCLAADADPNRDRARIHWEALDQFDSTGAMRMRPELRVGSEEGM